jgi:N6-adenosine-specific RNA methylase IME4
VVSRYRTIVADPPWEYPEGFALGTGHGTLVVRPLPYQSMPLDDICGLPVHAWADTHCRLFLWATNRWLDDAFDVVRAWRFKYRQTLVWHKPDANLPGHVAPNSAEFVLVAVRGAPPRLSVIPSAVIGITRTGGHSTKPEAWLDYFEAVSEGPYLEMFARRQRLGWDTWGDEALDHLADETPQSEPRFQAVCADSGEQRRKEPTGAFPTQSPQSVAEGQA